MSKTEKKGLVVLVNPRSGFWAENQLHPNLSPAMGLLTISVFLEKKYEIAFIDQSFDDWKERLQDALDKKPVFVATGFMTGTQIKHALDICRFVKEKSDRIIVVGGTHPSLLPEQTVKNELIDIVVIGEGEKTIVEIADALSSSKPLLEIKGIAFKKNKKIIMTQKKEYLDLEELPPLPYHLIENYFEYPYIKKYGIIIETSRGCPYKCTYCYNTAYNGGMWRKKSARKVIEEIRFLHQKYKTKHFHILDDNFFVDLNRAKEVLKGIVAINPNLKVEFEGVRADAINRMDDELINLFKTLNDGTMRVGIESGSEYILNKINKKTGVDVNLRANEILAKNKIRVYYNMMIGFPFESEAELKKTTRFTVELMDKNPYARIDFLANYQPYPGTRLYDYCIKNKYFDPPKTLQDWSEMNWNIPQLNCFSQEQVKLREKVSIASLGLAIRKKSNYKKISLDARILARIYRHIVRFRMKHFFFGLFFERFFYDLGLKKMNEDKYLIKRKQQYTQ